MNETDVLILVGILVFVILGIRDGFLRKIFGLLGFFAGLILGTKFMGSLSGVLQSTIDLSDEGSLALSFFLIFMAVMIVVNLFYRWFGQSGGDALKVWSRLGGALLGILQGLVAVSLVLVMFNLFDVPSEATRQGSILYNDVYRIAPEIFDYTSRFLPSSKKFFDEMKDQVAKLRQ